MSLQGRAIFHMHDSMYILHLNSLIISSIASPSQSTSQDHLPQLQTAEQLSQGAPIHDTVHVIVCTARATSH